jgi:hypothetical protein
MADAHLRRPLSCECGAPKSPVLVGRLSNPLNLVHEPGHDNPEKEVCRWNVHCTASLQNPEIRLHRRIMLNATH